MIARLLVDRLSQDGSILWMGLFNRMQLVYICLAKPALNMTVVGRQLSWMHATHVCWTLSLHVFNPINFQSVVSSSSASTSRYNCSCVILSIVHRVSFSFDFCLDHFIYCLPTCKWTIYTLFVAFRWFRIVLIRVTFSWAFGRVHIGLRIPIAMLTSRTIYQQGMTTRSWGQYRIRVVWKKKELSWPGFPSRPSLK